MVLKTIPPSERILLSRQTRITPSDVFRSWPTCCAAQAAVPSWSCGMRASDAVYVLSFTR